MNKIEIGIPVYNALDLLPNALNSLLCQTNKNFDVCIAIDGDGLDYTNIIEDFKNRGLNIRMIVSEKNMGPGYTRQLILDSTKAEYLSFLDADDMLLPHAIDFFENSRECNFDCAKGAALREIENMVAVLKDDNNITWLHGVVYSVKFLKEKNIQFLPLSSEEDGHFNLLVFNVTSNIGESDEPVYFVSNNLKSITRDGASDTSNKYTVEHGHNLFISFLIALQQLKDFEIDEQQLNNLVIPTLYELYEQYQRCAYFGSDMKRIDNIINQYKADWLKESINNIYAFIYMENRMHQYTVYNDHIIIPFQETFFQWLERFFLND